MNKPFATAMLALALVACSQTPTPHDTAVADAPKTGPSVKHTTPEERATRIAAAKKAMPAAASVDPQTDQAIDVMLGGHHAEYRRAIDDFQKAVAAKDQDKVAAMVQYPITIDVNGKKVVIESAMRFKQYYGAVIPPDNAKQIARSTYGDVMINNRGVLLGDGKTFLTSTCADPECKKVDVKISSFELKPGK